jgi:signal peptidase I
MENSTADKEQQTSWNIGKKIAFIVAAFIIYKLISLFIISFIIQPVKIEGNAMLPSLKPGDKIFVSKSVGNLQRGDIVIYKFPQDPSISMIHRIVGLPGETIECKDLKLFINGNEFNEPYLDKQYSTATFAPKGPVQIPSNSYFVIGDNRDASNDSRAFGPVGRDYIYGKYSWTYGSAQ